MEPSLCFENIWSDDDVIELKVTADDGNSNFSCKVYVGYKEMEILIRELNVFKNHIYGGVFDIELGAFGPEYANGAFHGRLHFYERGKLYISIRMQSDFYNFGKKNVASEAFLYLVSEPALFDSFISKLKLIDEEVGNKAALECLIDNI